MLKGQLSIPSLHHKDNGILLCVKCHRSLENMHAGWAFIPDKIDFLIHFEKNDRRRREEKFVSTGIFPRRKSPTSAQYSRQGALYQSYMERNYFPSAVAHDVVFTAGRSWLQPQPKTWHGDPLLALHRGFMLLGWAPYAFPSAVRDSLRALSDLYAENDIQPRAQTAVPPTTSDQGSQDTDSDSSEESDHGGNTGKRQRTLKPNARRQDNARHKNNSDTMKPPPETPNRRQSGRIQDQQTRQAALKRQHEDEVRRLLENPPEKRLKPEITEGVWKWGPLSSSDEAALEFRRSQQKARGRSRGIRPLLRSAVRGGK